jgi:hypothetical protein
MTDEQAREMLNELKAINIKFDKLIVLNKTVLDKMDGLN